MHKIRALCLLIRTETLEKGYRWPGENANGYVHSTAISYLYHLIPFRYFIKSPSVEITSVVLLSRIFR